MFRERRMINAEHLTVASMCFMQSAPAKVSVVELLRPACGKQRAEASSGRMPIAGRG